ncbi:MAG TPA: hypothetical protein EYM64_03205 [Phycisphaerales bacterium]|nr:hypothetical protein [Phycisphaerales bacterium]
MNETNNLTDKLGGLWVSLSLLVRCKFRTGKGSYLAWRRETAFGSKGSFPELTASKKYRSICAWATWAWQQQRNSSSNKE